MKKILLFALFTLIINGFNSLIAQSYNVNSNQQQININVPVIEKPVYIEKYRTVYVDKPRVARKLDKPVLLLGYLWVYPEDLGNFKQIPVSVINSVNAQNPYGRNSWRIPTPDELAVLEANADRIGLGDDIYLATDHCNGTLRLVAIEGEYPNCVKIGNTYWMKTNLGASTEEDKGSLVTYEDAVKYCPKGYRLPTEQEYQELIVSGKACFGGDFGANKASAQLYFPYNRSHEVTWYNGFTVGYSTEYYGEYWTSDVNYYMLFSHNTDSKTRPQTVRGGRGSECSVRYVLDK